MLRPGTRPGTASPRTPRGGLQRRSAHASKTFVVAIDGSMATTDALSLACSLRSPVDLIKIITVSVGITAKVDSDVELSLTNAIEGEKLVPDALLQAAKQELIRVYGVPGKLITTAIIDPDELTIAEALLRETNVLQEGVGLVVLGATGKGMAKRGPTHRQWKPIGSVAMHVLHHAKCPLVLAKGDSTLLHASAGAPPPVQASRPATAPMVPVRPPMVVCVCIENADNKGAWDGALRFVRGGGLRQTWAVPGALTHDEIHLVHVPTKTAEEEVRVMRQWVDEASKVMMAEGSEVVVKAAFLPPPKPKQLAKDLPTETAAALLKYCETVGCNLVVAGSSEVAKLSTQHSSNGGHGGVEASSSVLGSVVQAIAAGCAVPVVIDTHYSAL